MTQTLKTEIDWAAPMETLSRALGDIAIFAAGHIKSEEDLRALIGASRALSLAMKTVLPHISSERVVRAFSRARMQLAQSYGAALQRLEKTGT